MPAIKKGAHAFAVSADGVRPQGIAVFKLSPPV